MTKSCCWGWLMLLFSLGSWEGGNRKKMTLKSSRLYYHTHTQNTCNAYWYSNYMMTGLSCSTENKYILVFKYTQSAQPKHTAGWLWVPTSFFLLLSFDSKEIRCQLFRAHLLIQASKPASKSEPESLPSQILHSFFLGIDFHQKGEAFFRHIAGLIPGCCSETQQNINLLQEWVSPDEGRLRVSCTKF